MDILKCKEKFNNEFSYTLHKDDKTNVNVCCKIHRLF